MTAGQPAAVRDEVARTGAFIREAFSAAPRPGKDAITSPTPGYPVDYDLERKAIRAFFANRAWQQVTLQALMEEYEGDQSACLFFMTPAAFRYYLPSYMLICLQQFEAADMMVPSTLHLLSPDPVVPGMEAECEQEFRDRVAMLSAVERKAVARFLLAMQDAYAPVLPEADNPAGPLHGFWGQYLDDADRARIAPFSPDAANMVRRAAADLMRAHGGTGTG